MIEQIGMGGRVQLQKSWTADDLRNLSAEPSLRIVQYSESEVPGARLLKLLNEELFAVRPDVTLRIYGFHGQNAKLSVLTALPFVEKLSVDCSSKVEGLEHLGRLENLHELVLDVFELDSFDALYGVTSRLTRIGLGKTRSKKPDLSVLRRFHGLKRLELHGHKKGIETIRELQSLEELYVHGIPLEELGFLSELPELASLSIGQGKAESLEWLDGLPGLKKLRILSAKKLVELHVLTHLKQLERLEIIDQPLLKTLPDLKNLQALQLVVCNNVGLEDLDWILTAPKLNQLAFREVKMLEPSAFEQLIAARRPDKLSVAMAKGSKHKEVQAILEREGLFERQAWWIKSGF